MFFHEKTPNLVPIDQLDDVKVKAEEGLTFSINRPTGGYDVCVVRYNTCSHTTLTLRVGWWELELSWPNAWIPFAGR